jgi:3D (Asp-Asp-Asp) domain-containing protein
MRRRTVISLLTSLVLPLNAAPRKRPRTLTAMATAHSVEGETAAGTRSRPGTAAADPRYLPLGTRILVHGAGKYSGEYTVEDTGPAVKGHEIDLYMKSDSEAKQFGRQRVRVTVLRYGQ